MYCYNSAMNGVCSLQGSLFAIISWTNTTNGTLKWKNIKLSKGLWMSCVIFDSCLNSVCLFFEGVCVFECVSVCVCVFEGVHKGSYLQHIQGKLVCRGVCAF
jgi:hypothetical protein